MFIISLILISLIIGWGLDYLAFYVLPGWLHLAGSYIETHASTGGLIAQFGAALQKFSDLLLVSNLTPLLGVIVLCTPIAIFVLISSWLWMKGVRIRIKNTDRFVNKLLGS